MLSGEVDAERGPGPEGCVFVPSYGHWFKPLTVLPGHVGQDTADSLKALQEARSKELDEVSRKYSARAIEVAPFLQLRIKTATGGREG